MKVIRARTVFVFAALILILLTVVGAVLGFQLVTLLYPHSGNWPLAGLIIGLLVGMLAGMLLALQFVGYFRAKIWPSETKTARKQRAFATNRSRRLDLEATLMSADNITESKEKESSPQPTRRNLLHAAIVASFVVYLIAGVFRMLVWRLDFMWGFIPSLIYWVTILPFTFLTIFVYRKTRLPSRFELLAAILVVEIALFLVDCAI